MTASRSVRRVSCTWSRRRHLRSARARRSSTAWDGFGPGGCGDLRGRRHRAPQRGTVQSFSAALPARPLPLHDRPLARRQVCRRAGGGSASLPAGARARTGTGHEVGPGVRAGAGDRCAGPFAGLMPRSAAWRTRPPPRPGVLVGLHQQSGPAVDPRWLPDDLGRGAGERGPAQLPRPRPAPHREHPRRQYRRQHQAADGPDGPRVDEGRADPPARHRREGPGHRRRPVSTGDGRRPRLRPRRPRRSATAPAGTSAPARR